MQRKLVPSLYYSLNGLICPQRLEWRKVLGQKLFVDGEFAVKKYKIHIMLCEDFVSAIRSEWFGQALANDWNIRHVPYTNEDGITSTHAPFIKRAAAVILFTSEPRYENQVKALSSGVPLMVIIGKIIWNSNLICPRSVGSISKYETRPTPLGDDCATAFCMKIKTKKGTRKDSLFRYLSWDIN
jgi:hypothetical protein